MARPRAAAPPIEESATTCHRRRGPPAGHDAGGQQHRGDEHDQRPGGPALRPPRIGRGVEAHDAGRGERTERHEQPGEHQPPGPGKGAGAGRAELPCVLPAWPATGRRELLAPPEEVGGSAGDRASQDEERHQEVRRADLAGVGALLPQVGGELRPPACPDLRIQAVGVDGHPSEHQRGRAVGGAHAGPGPAAGRGGSKPWSGPPGEWVTAGGGSGARPGPGHGGAGGRLAGRCAVAGG
jgi:hypothetical protein